MRSFHKMFKTTFVLFLIWGFFVADILPVLAFPSASSIAAELERRYHLNLQSLQNQGELFNVSDQKKIAPETSLSFSPSDPKEGEKISAKAFSLYYSNPEESLYYTWYLKRNGCDRNNFPSKTKRELCDNDNDGKITIEDWKIEAARIIAQNGYEGPPANAPADEDGYFAKSGGDNKTNVPDYCYVHDADTGKNYELVESSSATTFSCPTGTSPVCMVVEADDSSKCSISGLPACTNSVPFCNVGSPYCVADPSTVTTCSAGTVLSSCSTTTSSGAGPVCKHLFPNAKGKLSDGESVDFTSGDGAFKEKEEKFWGTDPNDPDTADNRNKDEANVVGLGNQSFIWNYAAGDNVGVAVEGASMIQTKHDDSSFMIMWAFPKKDCPVVNKGSYTKRIKGYDVEIPTAAMDLNDCIEKNLVDPTQGGQATNLEVAVTAIPDNPVNDESGDKAGDTVIAQASVSNAGRNLADTLFEWKVQIGQDISFRPGKFEDITQPLRNAGLIRNTKGNALDSIAVKLDMPSSITNVCPDGGCLKNGTGYLRFKVDVTENFSSGIPRKGRSDVIVKFTSSQKKIIAYRARANPTDQNYTQTIICNEDALDRSACRVIKDEIIGLKIDPTGLSNFHWTINGAPLVCSRKYVSNDCADDNDEKQNHINFFPVTGNIGDTYTVVVTADDVVNAKTGTTGGNTGNTLTLTRAFHIVQPLVNIESLDKSVVWPKLLGQYKDITGKVTACPGGLCNDYSTFIFQAFSGSQLGFKAVFIPSFLKDISTREWEVDGELIAEDPAKSNELHFPANKLAGEIYNINLKAQVIQETDVRRALLDIWNISPFESAEINFATAIQVELKDPSIVQGPLQNERKYLAALISYIPASILFTFRILLSAGLALFVASLLYALLQDRRAKALVANIPEEKR
jgi:hypothetical protein